MVGDFHVDSFKNGLLWIMIRMDAHNTMKTYVAESHPMVFALSVFLDVGRHSRILVFKGKIEESGSIYTSRSLQPRAIVRSSNFGGLV